MIKFLKTESTTNSTEDYNAFADN